MVKNKTFEDNDMKMLIDIFNFENSRKCFSLQLVILFLGSKNLLRILYKTSLKGNF